MTAGLRRYRDAYRALLAHPIAFLAGQLVTFLVVSLYVKFVQMRYTAEYSAAWLGSGHLFANCRDYALFCAQEICVFAALLLVTVAWRRWQPRGWTSCAMAALAGLMVLPALSAIEVMGIAHFALFLTPLGPEEVRMLGWTGHLVSAGNVLRSPDVAAGLGLVVVGYMVAPPGLWLPRLPRWQPALLAGAVFASGLTFIAPKPLVTDALLAPHPLLWMLFGGRSQQIWETPDGEPPPQVSTQQPVSPVIVPAAYAPAGAAFAAPRSRRGTSVARTHLAVRNRPTNVLLLVLESTRASSLALYDPAAPAGRGLLRLRDEAVVFEHIYAPVPTSAHALFSILYGVYPYLGPFWTSAGKAVVANSMAQFFGRAGYATQFYITGDLDYDNVRSFAAHGFQGVLDSEQLARAGGLRDAAVGP